MSSHMDELLALLSLKIAENLGANPNTLNAVKVRPK